MIAGVASTVAPNEARSAVTAASVQPANAAASNAGASTAVATVQMVPVRLLTKLSMELQPCITASLKLWRLLSKVQRAAWSASARATDHLC